MSIVVISPEADDPREIDVLGELFSEGLDRYHVRKPSWSREDLASWLTRIPGEWRTKMILHQHHALAEELGCGGIHFKDTGTASSPVGNGREGRLTSRSCHDLETLRRAAGHFDAVFYSPVFPSISKVGYLPKPELSEVCQWLQNRSAEERKTEVVALGGVSAFNAALALEMGFDGVALFGALWSAAFPVRVFNQLRQKLASHAH
jgi:thiamine-phosphate pyrophosphorylase